MPRPDRVPLLVLLGGAGLTAIVCLLLARYALDRERQQFAAAAAVAQEAVLRKVETSVALLRGTGGLFASRRTPVGLEEFTAYVERIALRERYPGLLGIGFAQRLEAGKERELEEAMRRGGRTGFRVWPAAVPGLRSAITFLEPLDARNRAAIGFDMATHPVRREAMERARDQGRIAASGVVELVQEIEGRRQPGFLIYLPVYAGGTPPADVADRRARLQGFAYSPVRAGDFLSSAFLHEAAPSVGMRVVHASTGRSLYERGEPDAARRFRSVKTVDVEGQAWRFEFSSNVSWSDALLVPAIVALVGTLLSTILAELVRRERRASDRARESLEAERRARAEAETANRAKDQFLAMLSHELRTPLHSIIGWTSLLRAPQLPAAKRAQGVDVIERSARAQARLIDDLLDMSRIAAGKLSLERRRVDLAGLLDEAARTMAPRFEEKGVALETDAAGPCIAYADPARLQQVVSNLLANSLKFTPPGGRVVLRLAAGASEACIRVEDTGEGIEPEFLERLFDPFSQADLSSARRHGGLGLGLSIVRQLVTMHGGRVHAESAGRGQGASFEVRLPLDVPDDADGADAAPPSNLQPDGAELQGVRILVVDDDPDGRTFIESALGARGAEVRAAGSAAEALAALPGFRPALLVSDIGMPVMDGLELVRRVRALGDARLARTRAVAISAYAREADREAARAAGFDAYLAKPLDQRTLLLAIAAQLGGPQ